MSRICQECSRNVENPFYAVSAVLIDTLNKRIAFSDLELSLCSSDFMRIRADLHQNPERLSTAIGIGINSVASGVNEFSGTIQLSSSVYIYDTNYLFADKTTISHQLPKCVASLFYSRADPTWVQLTKEGNWEPALWATLLYRQFKI